MNGLALLALIRKTRRLPVIMFSALTERGGRGDARGARAGGHRLCHQARRTGSAGSRPCEQVRAGVAPQIRSCAPRIRPGATCCPGGAQQLARRPLRTRSDRVQQSSKCRDRRLHRRPQRAGDAASGASRESTGPGGDRAAHAAGLHAAAGGAPAPHISSALREARDGETLAPGRVDSARATTTWGCSRRLRTTVTLRSKVRPKTPAGRRSTFSFARASSLRRPQPRRSC